MADDDSKPYSQANRLIQVSVAVKDDPKDKQRFSGAEQLLLQSFTGQEGVSLPFHFDLVLRSFDQSIDFNNVVGQQATLKMLVPSGAANEEQSEMKARYVDGIISTLTELGQTRSSQSDDMAHVFTVYQATLVPKFWLLTRNFNSRIFQNQTVPDIIEAILKENGVSLVDDRLNKAGDPPRYPKREFCVQYNETDFDFVSRLMEDEGIFYFFEHTDKTHTLVLADSPTAFAKNPLLATAIYTAKKGVKNADLNNQDSPGRQDGMTAWNVAQEIRPDKFEFRDFNFEKPTADLTASATTDSKPSLEVYEYPGEYTEPSRGDQLVRVRMNQIEAAKVVVAGASKYQSLLPGYWFVLKGHFNNEFNNKEYVPISVYHVVDQGNEYQASATTSSCDYSYTNTFRSIPLRANGTDFTNFCPPRTTQKPVISSTQTAMVVGRDSAATNTSSGAAKEEIYTDEYGRVKVRFHWDRGKQPRAATGTDPSYPCGGDCSCWIRVAQPWAGNGWGHQWIPRIGHEVVVTFLDGNPDRPLITGSVYNKDNVPPFDPAHTPTQSGIKTHSTPGGKAQNFNLIRFEDKKGHEQLWIHAENAMLESVEGSQAITVGGNRSITTGGEKNGTRHGDTKELVYKNANLHVKGDARTGIDGKYSMNIQGDDVEFAKGGKYLSSSKEILLSAPNIYLNADTQIVLTVGGSSVVVDASGVTIVGPMVKLNPAGAVPAVAPLSPLTDAPEDP